MVFNDFTLSKSRKGIVPCGSRRFLVVPSGSWRFPWCLAGCDAGSRTGSRRIWLLFLLLLSLVRAHKQKLMDRRKEEGAGPEEAYFYGEGISALFEEGSSAPVDEEGKDAMCSKQEQDDQKLADKNKPCHGPI